MNFDSPTGAMVWKEARENLKWAALAFLATAGAMFFAVWEQMGWGRGGGYSGDGAPLIGDAFQMATTVCGAVAALLLALAQVLPEKRLDQWAFLVHRPASRTRLFAAKVVTGLVLYALAVGVPFACAAIWAATPGNVAAPFDGGMMLPGLADLLAGIVYYLAGMVIALREARWYGSRVLAIGLAVSCSFVVVAAPAFVHAMLAILVAGVLLGTAAWGSFVAGGNYRPQSLAAKASLGVAVFAGTLLLGGVGIGLIGELLPKPTVENTYTYTNYAIDRAGRVIRYVQRGQTLVSVTDAQGNVVPEYAGMDVNAFHTAVADTSAVALWLDADREMYHGLYSYRRWTRFFLSLTSYTPARSYYVHQERYHVAYSTDDASVIGYLTPAGFHPGPAEPADRFEGDVTSSFLSVPAQSMVASTTGVYKIDLTARKIGRVFTPPAGQRVISAAESVAQPVGPTPVGFRPATLFMAFATSTTLYVHGPDGRPLFSMPLEHGPADKHPQLTVTRRDELGRYYVWYQPQWMTPQSWSTPQHVVEVTPAGEVAGGYDLPPLPPMFAKGGHAAEAVLMGVAAPSAGLAIGILAVPWLQGEPVAPVLQDPDMRAAFLATLLSGLACAAITLVLARRYAFAPRERIGWTIANVLLGPAGVLTLLALREWPARETCPSCGRKRVVDRDHCPHCAAGFDPPPLDGTEIFAT